jgi:Eukaryotic cytochrome b561
VIFFIGEAVMMFVYTNRLNADPMKNAGSVHFKHAIAIMSVMVGIAALYFSSNWHRFSIQIAECEWLGVFLALIYNLSFLVEFKHLHIGEILAPEDNVYRQNFQTVQKV